MAKAATTTSALVEPREPRSRKPTAVRLCEGTRVRVLWPRDGIWHTGYVKKYDAKKALHTVVNDRGDSKRLDLRTTRWEFEDLNADPAQFLRPRGTRGRKKASASVSKPAALPSLCPVNTSNGANPSGSDSDNSYDPSYGTAVDGMQADVDAFEADDGFSRRAFPQTRRGRRRQYVVSDDESDEDTEVDDSEYDEDLRSDSETEIASAGSGKKRRWSDANLSGVAKRVKQEEFGTGRRQAEATEDIFASCRNRVEAESSSRDENSMSLFTLTEVAWEHQRLSSVKPSSVLPAKRPVGRPPKVKRGSTAPALAPGGDDDAAELSLIMAVARRLCKDKSVAAHQSSDSAASSVSPVSLSAEFRRVNFRECLAFEPETAMVEVEVMERGQLHVEGEVKKAMVHVDVQSHMDECSDLRTVHVPVASVAAMPASLRFVASQAYCSGSVQMAHFVPGFVRASGGGAIPA